ncbi:hypothetical protein M231_03730 [Tremella mesenterica]|uniref:Uncharacterized protein n=1 Tax=Tremella mesenterica TaxID=5217 RepID=A0A4Q1BMP9_TREME|nr:hypothetical protein M231_03730 [Tremella mesenterica]
MSPIDQEASVEDTIIVNEEVGSGETNTSIVEPNSIQNIHDNVNISKDNISDTITSNANISKGNTSGDQSSEVRTTTEKHRTKRRKLTHPTCHLNLNLKMMIHYSNRSKTARQHTHVDAHFLMTFQEAARLVVEYEPRHQHNEDPKHLLRQFLHVFKPKKVGKIVRIVSGRDILRWKDTEYSVGEETDTNGSKWTKNIKLNDKFIAVGFLSIKTFAKDPEERRAVVDEVINDARKKLTSLNEAERERRKIKQMIRFIHQFMKRE